MSFEPVFDECVIIDHALARESDARRAPMRARDSQRTISLLKKKDELENVHDATVFAFTAEEKYEMECRIEALEKQNELLMRTENELLLRIFSHENETRERLETKKSSMNDDDEGEDYNDSKVVQMRARERKTRKTLIECVKMLEICCEEMEKNKTLLVNEKKKKHEKKKMKKKLTKNDNIDIVDVRSKKTTSKKQTPLPDTPPFEKKNFWSFKRRAERDESSYSEEEDAFNNNRYGSFLLGDLEENETNDEDYEEEEEEEEVETFYESENETNYENESESDQQRQQNSRDSIERDEQGSELSTDYANDSSIEDVLSRSVHLNSRLENLELRMRALASVKK